MLEFTEAQIAILHGFLDREEGVISSFRFDEPEKDQIRIRQHAAVSGSRDMLLELLTYDQKEQLRKEIEKNETLNQELRQQQLSDDTLPQF